jgi:beta-glucosidase
MDRRNFLGVMGMAGTAALAPRMSRPGQLGLSGAELEAKVKSLLAKMTLEEKADQMSGRLFTLGQLQGFSYGESPGNQRLGIPALRTLGASRGAGLSKATVFPVSMCRGASWDIALERQVGEAIGYETRAKGCHCLLGPCVNLVRHPSWGRAQETYGEDPLLLGLMGAAHVTGAQQHVMTSPKHFAGNSIDDTRMFVNIVMDERTLREIYLPHFKRCVDAGAATIMSSYNHLNGYFAGQNRHLITEILKEDWGFQGLVMSDWSTAMDDTVAAANAGMDLEMPDGNAHYGKKLVKAVRDGKVPEKNIDDSVTRILRQKFRFITPDFFKGYERSRVGGKDAALLAKKAATSGMVLLKNQGQALPLDEGGIKSLAVMGRLADYHNLGDLGSSAVLPPYSVSALEGVRARAGKNLKVEYCRGDSIGEAQRVAKKVDAVVIVAGMTWRDEGEHLDYWGGDRPNLELHPAEIKLIDAVSGANQRCIVVLEGGSAITMESWKEKVPAILMAWYPGMEGGNALAEILFGDVSPSGKLPLAFPKSLDQLFKFDNKSKTVEYGYYHGYRWFDKHGLEPAFPFGFGLSYTSFKYDRLALQSKAVKPDGKVRAQVDITNLGGRAGEEVVQLYVSYPGTKIDRPVKDLRAFVKVGLKPHETKTVSLEFDAHDLAWFNPDRAQWQIEDLDYLVQVGPSSRSQDLICKDSFRVQGL